MLKEALFLGLLLSMIAEVPGSLTAKRQKKPGSIDVPVKSDGGNCKYHDKQIPHDSVHFYEDPCEVVFCNRNANEVTIAGCPAPKTIAAKGNGKQWPHCCR
uniref:Putative salivary secreted protein n=1 Tax=Hyalomma rufipes TaxID=72862 RepID=E2J6T3_HYARU